MERNKLEVYDELTSHCRLDMTIKQEKFSAGDGQILKD